MKKKNTPGNCCCCKIMHTGGASLKSTNLKVMPGDPIENPSFPDDYPDPFEWPVEGSLLCSSLTSGAAWALDHRNKKFVLSGLPGSPFANNKVSIMDAPVKLALADIVRTAIPGAETTSPEILRGVGCLPWTDGGRALWIVQMTATTPTTFEVRSCKYDGTDADSWAFSDTLSAVTAPQYCKANNKLYYSRTKTGVDDSKSSVYRCDLDGSNNELVFAPGPNAGSPTMNIGAPTGTVTFDNVNQKLYVGKTYVNSSFGVDNWGEIYQMNLDGSSPSLYYETTKLSRPYSGHGVRVARYSHSRKGLYMFVYSSEIGSSDPAWPDAGLFFLSDTDGAAGVAPGAAKHLKSGKQSDSLSSTNPPSTSLLDLGCGFETFGKSTKR